MVNHNGDHKFAAAIATAIVIADPSQKIEEFLLPLAIVIAAAIVVIDLS